MRLGEVVAVSATVRATRSRKAKRAAIAELLLRADRTALPLVATYLAGELRQRRTGLGWSSLRELPPPSTAPTLELAEVDAAFERLASLQGPGSAGARRSAAADLFSRATEAEQEFLSGLVSGNLRQGALDAVVLDAVADAWQLDPALVRRAAMLSGSTPEVVVAAADGGAEALTSIGLTLGRPVRPMLAGSAPTPGEALAGATGPVAVDVKLDGIRVQVHRRGGEVRVFTRSLDEITARLPDVAAQAGRLPGGDLVLDGEALLLGEDGRPRPFQETAARSATLGPGAEMVARFFDVLHHDGVDLLDAPLAERLEVLDRLVPPHQRVRRVHTADPAEATRFFEDVVTDGGEGIVVKQLGAPYAAGQRGAAWVKVKPRHTLDLVVVAVEWGSGRRTGMLSNIHLAARDEDGALVMLGKTFKGMTDEVLAWQTRRFLDLETHREGHVVHVRPEQVVEIAFDGVQRSRRYPGGVALRFARVIRYRDDKPVSAIDTLETVRSHLP